jgi:AcrR family transcriptional regulator
MKEQGAKERILHTASELFYQQGYLATGINQIIEEAGIAKASLYQHFPSKEALLNEYLLKTRVSNHEDRMQYISRLTPGKEKLLGLFRFRIQHMKDNQFKGCAFVRIAYELPALNEEGREQIRIHTQTLKSFIASQLQVIKDPFPEPALEEMVEMVLNVYEGAGIQAYILRSVKPVEDALKVVQRLLDTL